MNKLLNGFKVAKESVIEAKRRKAAYETALILQRNPDFKSWSHQEIYNHIMDKENPVGLDKRPLKEAV